MKPKINIFIVDDHQIVIDGLLAILKDAETINICGYSNGDNNATEEIINSNSDIVLMDISLENLSGIDVTKDIVSKNKKIKIIMLSMYNSEEVIFSAIDAGASGYLPKNTTKEEIVKAINTVYSGKTYFNSEIASVMLESMIHRRKSNQEKEINPCLDCLTTREIQTLKLFALGFTNQEIADKLFISVRTVESHKTHIMQKLNFKSMVEMIKFAIRQKLIEI